MSSKPVSVRSGQVEFLKLNLQRREYRDIYQWVLSLKWPEFATTAPFFMSSK